MTHQYFRSERVTVHVEVAYFTGAILIRASIFCKLAFGRNKLVFHIHVLVTYCCFIKGRESSDIRHVVHFDVYCEIVIIVVSTVFY